MKKLPGSSDVLYLCWWWWGWGYAMTGTTGLRLQGSDYVIRWLQPFPFTSYKPQMKADPRETSGHALPVLCE